MTAHEPTDDELIGDWEPTPALTKSMAAQLQAKIERLRVLSRRKFPEQDLPLWECRCENTGWIPVADDGRGSVRSCPQCGGPTNWCRHRRRLVSCDDCKPRKQTQKIRDDDVF